MARCSRVLVVTELVESGTQCTYHNQCVHHLVESMKHHTHPGTPLHHLYQV